MTVPLEKRRDLTHVVASLPMPVFTLIAGRTRDLGSFSVRRALPSMQRRLIGPFIFWDHMGPAELGPGHGMDVRPHPHINLATVTYLFEGEIVHKDSLGSDQAIRPGDVNWMTAGRGIVHSERTGAELRKTGGAVHGIQSWVALPTELEETEPAFQHIDGKLLPELDEKGVRLRVIAGTAFGATAPVHVMSPTFYVEARLNAGAELTLPEAYEERAAYVVEGAIECDGQTVPTATMAIAEGGVRATIRALQPARVMLLGGAPIGQRHIWWNFVSSSEERIERAKREWKGGAFPRVPGDDVEFIPLPE
jgi:redox-sensitive bicupin YhaK (pirin superfamily)